MTDREKIIKELQGLCGSKETMKLIADAIELLDEQQETISSFQGTIRKLSAALEEQAEQEPVKPKYTPKSIYSWECGVCNEPFDRTANYCPQCGRPVKWE